MEQVKGRQSSACGKVVPWLLLGGLAGLVVPWVGAALAASGFLFSVSSPGEFENRRIILLAGAIITACGLGLSVVHMVSATSPLDAVQAAFADAPGRSYFVFVVLFVLLAFLYWVGIQGKALLGKPARYQDAIGPAIMVIPLGIIAARQWGDWGWFALLLFNAVVAALTSILASWHLRRRTLPKEK